MKRYITKEDYQRAFGLFITAKMYQERVDTAERELNEILGLENGSHFSDEIYGYDWTFPEVETRFNNALSRESLGVLSNEGTRSGGDT